MVKSIENGNSFGKTEMSYDLSLEKYMSQMITCGACGKSKAISDWPKQKSTGRPKKTCCRTTGWNNKQKYLDRQKKIDGKNCFLCRSCNKHKQENDFYRSKGLVHSTCKQCHSERYAGYKSPLKKKTQAQLKISKIKERNEKIECKACGKKINKKDFPKMKDGSLAERCCSERTVASINNALRKRGMRFCGNCGLVKPFDHFTKKANGYVNYCKPCQKYVLIKRQYNQKRACRINATDDGTLNSETLKNLFIPQKKCCVCSKEMQFEDKTLDHLLPLSLGGSHTISNAIIMCHRCNSSKNRKHPKDWFNNLVEDSKKSVLKYIDSRPEISRSDIL